MIKGLCEKAVWFVWDLFLKVKEYFVGQEVITLSKEKRLSNNGKVRQMVEIEKSSVAAEDLYKHVWVIYLQLNYRA